MNFEFSDEQQLLREQARGFLTEHCPTSAVRAVLDGDQDWDAALWQKVADMGWTATVIPEAYGGLGLSYYELAIIAEEMGKGVEVRITGFGIFSASQTKEREGRNPRTGEKMTIAASTQPKFKAFKALKDSLNG